MNGAAPVPAPESPTPDTGYPFWTWQDLALFAMLAIPSLVAAFALVQAVIFFSGYQPAGRAAPLLAGQFLGYGFLFLALYGILKLRYSRPFWPSLGWVRPQRDLLAAVLGGPLVALAVAVLGVVLRTPEIEMPIRELLTDRLSILLVGTFATTLGPVCEELAFRGFLLPLAVRTAGAAPGLILSALPFALLHGPQYGWSWRHVLLITLAGVAFGWIRLRTRSTLAAALMHAGYNLTFFSAYLIQGKDFPSQW